MGNAPSSDGTMTTTTGSLISNSPVTNTNFNSTVTSTPTTFTPRTGTIGKKIDDDTTVTATTDDDTTFDFLDDELEIGDYKIKYKYIIGGVLVMVLLMKKK